MPLDRKPFAAQRDREMSRLDLAKFERPARPGRPFRSATTRQNTSEAKARM